MRKFMLAWMLVLLVLGNGVYARASAVTLKLMDVGPGYSDAGAYVYPYNFSINGSLTEIALLCDDYNDEIYIGETWTATVSTGSAILTAGQMDRDLISPYAVNSGFGSVAAVTNRTKAYEDAAWLYQQLVVTPPGVNGANYAAINETIWALFSDTSTHYFTPTGPGSWFALAEANSSLADLDNVTLYTPVPGSQSCCGRPQEFFGTPVPEPGSLALLSFGLIGLGMISRKDHFSGTGD